MNINDLKVYVTTSNDYLHILRLRYDNRWLKTYWEAKLKEVEKEYNFFLSTPINKKIDNSIINKFNTNFIINKNSLYNNYNNVLTLIQVIWYGVCPMVDRLNEFFEGNKGKFGDGYWFANRMLLYQFGCCICCNGFVAQVVICESFIFVLI